MHGTLMSNNYTDIMWIVHQACRLSHLQKIIKKICSGIGYSLKCSSESVNELKEDAAYVHPFSKLQSWYIHPIYDRFLSNATERQTPDQIVEQRGSPKCSQRMNESGTDRIHHSLHHHKYCISQPT